MQANFLQIVPKCLDDEIYTESTSVTVKTSDKRNIHCPLNYCPKCKSYLTSEGMEPDVKKAALRVIQTLNSSYELSDIVDVTRKKK